MAVVGAVLLALLICPALELDAVTICTDKSRLVSPGHPGPELKFTRSRWDACSFNVSTLVGNRFELNISIGKGAVESCQKDEERLTCSPGPKDVECSQAFVMDDAGWFGTPAIQLHNSTTASLMSLHRAGITHLLSKSNSLHFAFCGSHGSLAVNIQVRIVVVTQTTEVHGPPPEGGDEYTFKAPWFPVGYSQSGQVYQYRFFKLSQTGIPYDAVVISFSDLNLAPGDNIKVDRWLISGLTRQSVYVPFRTSHSVNLDVNISDTSGRWSRRVGWKFTVKYLRIIPHNGGVDLIQLSTQHIDVQAAIHSGHQLSITAYNRLVDNLYVFYNIPPDIRLSVHVIVFTQTEAELIRMVIRDGTHSESRLVANVTKQTDLSSQPKHGYVTSTGAYIRIVSTWPEQYSVITLAVTPFRVKVDSMGVPSQCCRYPTDESEKGGFLCARVMRCVPASTACNGLDNCGDKEDEERLACRGNRLEQFGMTARNVCAIHAKTVMCPWGAWVAVASDCYKGNKNSNPSLLVMIGVTAGCVGLLLSILSLIYRRRILQSRRAFERDRAATNQGRGQRPPNRRSRNECHVPARQTPGSDVGTGTELRLQMGVLPPSYDEVRSMGTAPPMYTEEVDIDQTSEYQRDNPPTYEVAITHKKADDAMFTNNNMDAEGCTSSDGTSVPGEIASSTTLDSQSAEEA